jgi:Bacterial SH3 domain
MRGRDLCAVPRTRTALSLRAVRKTETVPRIELKFRQFALNDKEGSVLQRNRATMNFAQIATCAAALMALSAQCAQAEPALATNNVNLRQGPGTNYPVITRIPGGSTVEVSACRGEWCAASWHGQNGYMIATSLDKGGGAPPPPGAGGPPPGPGGPTPPPGAGGSPPPPGGPPPPGTSAGGPYPPGAPPPGYPPPGYPPPGYPPPGYPPPPGYAPPPGYYYPPGYNPYYYYGPGYYGRYYYYRGYWRRRW